MASPPRAYLKLVRTPTPDDRQGSEPFEWRWQWIDGDTLVMQSAHGWVRRDHAIQQARQWTIRHAQGEGRGAVRLEVWAPPVRRPDGELEQVE